MLNHEASNLKELKNIKKCYRGKENSVKKTISQQQFVGRTERACASKEAFKPDSVTPALSGGMGQNSPNLTFWKATQND